MAAQKTHNGSAVKGTQAILSKMVQELLALHLPRLGQDYCSLSGLALHEALVSHRLTKSYEEPDGRVSKARRERSIRGFLDTDESNGGVFDYRSLDQPVRAGFLKAQLWLRDLFKGFRPTYRAYFPTGETVESAGGLTDLYYKLSQDSQWQVGIDCVDYASRVAYNTLALRRLTRTKFRESFPHRWKRMLRDWWFNSPLPNAERRRYCFRMMFAACCDINGCSRVTTVPKDNQKDRVITCEPLWNMVAQLSFARDVREALRRFTGIDISFWQNVHRARIRGGAATIDFSDASNRNRWEVVKVLFPPHVVKHLRCLRNSVFVVGSGSQAEYYPANMLSPMGNGFTFDVMTITLLAYARVYDATASVFGDDVIIKTESAHSFIDLTTALGWKVNRNKSFLEGNFRESCGAFADLEHNKLLVSYDLHWPETLADCYIQANKVSVLLDALDPGPVAQILFRAFAALHEVLPSNAFWWDGSCELWDWRFRTRVPPATSSIPPVLATLLSQQWQRVVELRPRFRVVREALPLRRDQVSQTLASSYLFRGSSYGIPKKGSKEVVETVDMETGVPLTAVTLVSVLI